MDMKKLLTNFRQFGRERRKAKLLKIKMSRFTVKYQKLDQPELRNVTLEVVQGAAIFFRKDNVNFHYLRDMDIASFDDTIPSEVTLILEEDANVHLQFMDEERKLDFVAAVTTFLQLSNNLSPGGSTDSGRSTLS